MAYATAVVVRSTHTTMNPFAPKSNEYYDADQVAYVMQNNRGIVRVVTSFGSLGESYEVGNCTTLISDANGRDLGVHTIVAIVDFTTMTSYIAKNYSKALINRKLKHCVVK